MINTGLIGWVLNIVLCICAGDIQAAGADGLRLGERTGNAVLEILYLRIVSWCERALLTRGQSRIHGFVGPCLPHICFHSAGRTAR